MSIAWFRAIRTTPSVRIAGVYELARAITAREKKLMNKDR
jgi:hypothetical protein